MGLSEIERGLANRPMQDDDSGFSFRHLANYASAFDLAILEAWRGSEWPNAVAENLKPLAQQMVRAGEKVLCSKATAALKRAWETERLLRFTLVNKESVQAATPWVPIQAYYAIHAATWAWLCADRPSPPVNHTQQLKLVSEFFTARAGIPFPLSVGYRGRNASGLPDNSYDPTVDSLLRPSPHTLNHFLFLAVRYARREQLDRKRTDWLAKNPERKRLSPGQQNDWDAKMAPATVVDFLYQLRRRANYDDLDPFVSGGLSGDEPERFFEALCRITAFINFVSEVLLASRVGVHSLNDMVRQQRPAAAAPAAPGIPSVTERASSWELALK